ncbi:MAG: hypothetical protein A2V70_03340 [Planctomycetes bacterium RBG_13_63_9]|nr:MAG: hypothetical protein A2V70_03340 [Planctomycetes bacterium RBG_13_63_9]
MHKNKAKTRIPIIIGVTVIAGVVGVILLVYRGDALSVSVGEPVLDGDSRELKATKVVPTLDAPIPKAMNAIWCASFLSAWKTLETDLAKEPLFLQGSPEVVLALNKAADPRPHIPEASLYVAAGWNQQGITDRIEKDLAQKFPTAIQPTFPGILPNSFVAYAYLEANVKFSLPYFQNREPMVFTDRAGNKTELSSFGIRPEDDYAYFELRRQPAILFETREEFKLTECIVDLDRTSQPNQIILAFMEPKPTLAEMLATVEDKIDTARKKEELGPNDVLLVPDMVWRITHEFAELQGQEFTNAKLKGQRIDVARQDIQFRLDRSGAELESEAKTYMLPIPTYYVFDRPFLLCMKKRGAGMPYFVMWIENAELLNKWQPNRKPQQNAPAT